MSNKVYGYARVSSKEQNLDRQIIAIEEYCKNNNLEIDERDIITDKASGKDFNREGYKLLKEKLLRQGDVLIIKELDRLGRDKNQIKEEWHELQKNGIDIIVIDNEILNTNNKSDLEKSLISNIVFELLSYMAEKERAKIKQRQREGIEALKEKNNGKGIGRPKTEYPTTWEEIYKSWKVGDITATKAMEMLELKRNTFYRLVKEYEEAK